MTKKLLCVFDFISSIEIMPLEDAFLYTSGYAVSWDTCYIKKIPSEYLRLQYCSNSEKIVITEGVSEEININLSSDETYKYELIKDIINNNGTYSDYDKLAKSSTDNSVVNAVKIDDGVPFTGDYGVIAYARSLGIKSVYLIDEEEIQKSNGIDNFKGIYRKKVGRKEKLINNK